MKTCLSGSDLRDYKNAKEAYLEDGAPVLDSHLPDMAKIELQLNLIDDSAENYTGEAYPGEPDREQAENPAPTAASLLEIVQETKAMRQDLETQLLEQGAAAGEARKLSDEAYPLPVFTQENLSIDPKYVLSGSYKLDKASGYGWYTPGLYLAPATMSRVADTCSSASDGCRSACLVASGRSDMSGQGSEGIIENLVAGKKLGSTIEARMRRTLLYVFNREDFRRMIVEAIKSHKKIADADGLNFGIRLNATSDIGWESEGLMEEFPSATYYDYTKLPGRVSTFLESKAFKEYGGELCAESGCIIEHNPNSRWPKNYYLSFSFSEINMAWCLVFLRRGGNVVVPFDNSLGKDVLPTHFLGRPVVDGDIFDMRFFDYRYWRDSGTTTEPPPYIIGLSVKGLKQRRAQQDIAESGGFFFSAKDAQERGNDPDFIVKSLARNVRECFKQKLARKKNPMMSLPSVSTFKKYVPEFASAYADMISENMSHFGGK